MSSKFQTNSKFKYLKFPKLQILRSLTSPAMPNKKKKILLVEDDQIVIEILVKKLEKEGYSIVVARDGNEGLKKMREETPDVILLDMVMPKKGGMEVLEEMHVDRKLSKIPVVIISNSGQPVELERAKALGVSDWLIKTEFDPEEVVEKVRGQVGNK